jgi:hypothetical protein
MKIVITESQLMFIRRYEELKDWVRSDYNFLLYEGFPPDEAKGMTIDHSAMTYLDDSNATIEWTHENLEKLRQFIKDNFEDLIS